ncbi:MAG: M48 family metalloprotease, partial [Chloroflexi bacterium]|nr:M48 family metalloprotease [Chloroflexota bacterium]
APWVGFFRQVGKWGVKSHQNVIAIHVPLPPDRCDSQPTFKQKPVSGGGAGAGVLTAAVESIDHTPPSPVWKLDQQPVPAPIGIDRPEQREIGSEANAAVAVTTGIMRILTDRELRAVIGHELGHVKNRDILISSIVATIAGAISMLAFISIFFRNSRSPYAFLAIIVAWVIAPIAAGIIQASISRTREFQADRTGAELTHDPASLATALEKLHQGIKERPMEATPLAESTAHLYIVHPFKAGGLANLFSTHPPVEERVKRLRDMAYKRT